MLAREPRTMPRLADWSTINLPVAFVYSINHYKAKAIL